MAGTENATGDAQKKLDVLSNEMFVNALYNSQQCAVLVSEENDEPIIVEESMAGIGKMERTVNIMSSQVYLHHVVFQGNYCVAFDPLDGSSNIDCNVPTGTIFAVWERVSVIGKALL